MKNKKIKKQVSLFDTLGLSIIIIIGLSACYFIYGITTSIKDENATISSNQVWCSNCQTFHDKATAEEESNRLIWCVNCNKYHLPGQDQ